MRALVIQPGPQYSVADVAHGWVQGLRANGVECVDVNFDDRLSFYNRACFEREQGVFTPAFDNPEHAARVAAEGILSAAYKVWPEIVLIISGFFVPPETYHMLRSRGHKVVLVHTESPYEDERQLMRAPHADINVLNDPTNIERFEDIGPAVYMPHAYDPDIHYPRPADPAVASDFCFVGTGYPSRIDFLERCNFDGIDVTIAGNWQGVDDDSPLRKYLLDEPGQCCPNDEAAVLYASTKASANIYRKETYDGDTADGWAMGPREVELAAIGTFQLREARGEGDEVLHMLPTFDGPDDFSEKLRWWLAHDSVREEAARLARLAVADRTFQKHAAQLLKLVAA